MVQGEMVPRDGNSQGTSEPLKLLRNFRRRKLSVYRRRGLKSSLLAAQIATITKAKMGELNRPHGIRRNQIRHQACRTLKLGYRPNCAL